MCSTCTLLVGTGTLEICIINTHRQQFICNPCSSPAHMLPSTHPQHVPPPTFSRLPTHHLLATYPPPPPHPCRPASPAAGCHRRCHCCFPVPCTHQGLCVQQPLDIVDGYGPVPGAGAGAGILGGCQVGFMDVRMHQIGSA